MFFVISTGRSGTQTIAKTLSQIPGCSCLHEPEPELILESSAYRYGQIDPKALNEILSKTRASEIKGKKYGESNQALSLIIPALTETFPEAKFIWLIRNGLDVVSSIVARKWYTGHTYKHNNYNDCAPIEKLWIDGRIEGDRCGDVPKAQWNEMNSFARCCWYWSYLNRTIESDLNKHVEIDRFRKVSLEALNTQLPDLISWLGFNTINNVVVDHNNKAEYTTYKWTQWIESEKRTFLYWCGPLMDKLYHGWQKKTDSNKNLKSLADKHQAKAPKDHNFEEISPFSQTNKTPDICIQFTPQLTHKARISVYIPSYNQKQFLVEAIESVLNQTLPPHQIIIIDDCSTDGSQDIIAGYHKQYPDIITPIYHSANKGITQTRIDAMNAVTGDYVTYVDGDDRFLPTKLEKEFTLLSTSPQAQIAFSNNYYMKQDGTRTDMWAKNELPPEGEIFKETFSRNFPRQSLYRMELASYQAWKAIGFHDTNLNIYEDFDIRIRMTKHYKAVYYNEPLSEIRLHQHGLSKLPKSQHLTSLKYIFKKNKSLLNDLNLSDRIDIETRINKWINQNIKKNTNRNNTFSLSENNHRSTVQPSIQEGSLGSNLIFIISQPRAGSTLLQRILAGHPEIHTTAEPWVMLHPIYAFKEKGLVADYDSKLAKQALDNFLTHSPEKEELYIKAIRSMANTLYDGMLKNSGKRLFLDKTPRYYNIIPELYRVFPNAKYIILLRNPVAVCSSILETWFKNNPESLMKKLPICNDLLLAPGLLIQGIQHLKQNAIVVHYEQLVTNPAENLLSLCNQLEIPFKKNMLKYANTPAPKGRLGDPIGVHKHDMAVSNYVNKWTHHLPENNLTEFALTYAKQLGPDLFSNLGYSYEDTINILMQGDYDNKNTPEDFNRQGEELFNKGKTVKAIELFLTAIKKNPNFALAHNNLCVAYWNSGMQQKAVEHLRKAQSLAPNEKHVKKNADLIFETLDQKATT